MSTLIDENTLAGSGAKSTRGICAAAAYFETLITPESLEFGQRYTQRFGADAPTLNSVGESCYEGILLLSSLARRAGSLDVARMTATAESLSYGGPRGEVRMHERHLDQRDLPGGGQRAPLRRRRADLAEQRLQLPADGQPHPLDVLLARVEDAHAQAVERRDDQPDVEIRRGSR